MNPRSHVFTALNKELIQARNKVKHQLEVNSETFRRLNARNTERLKSLHIQRRVFSNIGMLRP